MRKIRFELPGVVFDFTAGSGQNVQWQSGPPVPEMVAGVRKSAVRSEGRDGDLALTLTVVTAKSLDKTTLRLEVCNTSTQEVCLGRFAVFKIGSGDRFDFDGVAPSNWRISAQKRDKYGIPDALEFADIAVGCDFDGHKTDGAVFGDSLIAIDNRRRVLLAGFVELDKQLAELRLIRNGETLAGFEAVCEFDNRVLDPGESVALQTLEILTAPDLDTALRRYSADVLTFYPKHKIVNPLTVASSWHYYGLTVSQKTVETEIAAMKHRAIPVDVMQIDGGWYQKMGDWDVRLDRFPGGLEALSDTIRKAGYIPGLWLGGFLMAEDSKLALAHPDWALRRQDGKLERFKCSQNCLLLDTSIPEVTDHLEWLFRNLRRWFGYFKVDFTRHIFDDPEARPRNRKWNRLDLWTAGFKAIRRGIGPDAHLNICGGHYCGALLVGDSARSSSDTYGRWTPPQVLESSRRAWMRDLWLTDPDALALRLCDKPWNATEHGALSLGNLTLIEARCYAATQFVCGGMTAFGDPSEELPEERLKIIRSVMPSVNSPGRMLKPFPEKGEAEIYLTSCAAAGLNWGVFTAISVADTPQTFTLTLGRHAMSFAANCSEFLAFDLIVKRAIGVFRPGQTADFGMVDPHGSRTVIAMPLPKADNVPFFIATDLHLSGGKNEVTAVTVDNNRIAVTLNSPWKQGCARLFAGIRRRGEVTVNAVEFNLAKLCHPVEIAF